MMQKLCEALGTSAASILDPVEEFAAFDSKMIAEEEFESESNS